MVLPTLRTAYVFVFLALLSACSGSITTDPIDEGPPPPPPSLAIKQFPQGLNLASPLDWASASASRSSLLNKEIEAVLNSEAAVSDVFNAEDLIAQASHASCFGPAVAYINHPDDPAYPAGAGTLPPGDVGLWQQDQGVTTQACSAAEFNTVMQHLRDRHHAALLLLAALHAAWREKQISLPGLNETLNLADAMNSAGIPGVVFTNAFFSQGNEGQWFYYLSFSFTRLSEVSVAIQLEHNQDSTNADDILSYNGLLYVQINGQDSDLPGSACALAQRSLNYTLRYVRENENSMQIQSREGLFCDWEECDPLGSNFCRTVQEPSAIDYGQLETALTLSSYTNGWGENFSVYGANYDPLTQAGHYAFIWQNRETEAYSRILALQLNNVMPQTGETYFGFSNNKIHTHNGQIEGMMCNLSVPPAATPVMQTLAQRQKLLFNASTGVFEQPAADCSLAGGDHCDLAYAPTNGCAYSGAGSFQYDKNADGDTTDADEAASIAVVPDLLAPNLSGLIPPTLAARGYIHPVLPGGWPSES